MYIYIGWLEPPSEAYGQRYFYYYNFVNNDTLKLGGKWYCTWTPMHGKNKEGVLNNVFFVFVFVLASDIVRKFNTFSIFHILQKNL